MDRCNYLMGYEVIRFMSENDIKISKLSQQCGYTIWELRGACSCGGLGYGEIGEAVVSALERMTGKTVYTHNFKGYAIHCYKVIVRSKGNSKEKSYNMFCLEDSVYDIETLKDYVNRIYGGYFKNIVYMYDI